ncbi:TipAS antibiotic-recognition domain-containing protein [Phosphitispora sp. TUW77]|uniref:TipAS antibiotic-recognition domain-containing protein n=1 Tax=Phosphitispora sp. TUW77 TaxID=3152361 RepID=UPI003AB14917
MLIDSLEKAEKQLQAKGNIDVKLLINIIKLTTSEKEIDWLQKYFTRDELLQIGRKLYRSLTEEELKKRYEENKKFSEKIRASLNLDPASSDAQELAKHWKVNMDKFVQENEELEKKLRDLYLDIDKLTSAFFNSWDSKMIEFMTKAIKIYNSLN